MKNKSKFPSGIPYIIGNEAAERFSFYGMKAILTTFLVARFYNPAHAPELQAEAEAHANNITHLFNTMVYFLPLAGAIISDWFWGKYKTIIILSLVYCLGHAFLSAFDTNLTGFLCGLMLIAMGSGGIKPCVSANVGDQFDESNRHLLTKAYSFFYFSVNFGSFFSILLTPLIMRNFGAAWAFGVPGILMGIATLLFFLGRKKYRRLPPSGPKKENFLAITFYALKHFGQRKAAGSLLSVAKQKYSAESVEGVRSVWKILSVFSIVPVFWALSDQNGSEWVLQATKMDLHFMGHTFLAEQVQAMNPILVLIFIPLFNFGLFPLLKKMGMDPTPYGKIAAGLICTAISFIFIYGIQLRIDAGETPTIGWQLIAYVIITAGEVLVYQTGLEYAYTQAPASMKSTIMAFWLLTASIGNYIVSGINESIANHGIFSFLSGADYYLFFIILMSSTTLVYMLLSKKIFSK